MPYIRSIFIGLGGSGIATISCLKKKYITNEPNGTIPAAVRFLGIDADYADAHLKGNDLSVNEFIILSARNVYERYLQTKQEGPNINIPIANVNYLKELRDRGSGMCRSNGLYLYELNKELISRRLAFLRDELHNVQVGVIPTPNVGEAYKGKCSTVEIFW